MKYKAVIFDLFGTLTEEIPRPEYERALSQMATIVSVPQDDLTRLWYETTEDRGTGSLPTVEANIEHVCRLLGERPKAAGISAAARIWTDFVRRMLTLRPDTVETLAHLKKAGHKIGLISNCSPEAPVLWPELPVAPLVEVAIFSCQAGLMKPDERIYQLACQRLAVSPQDCLYIGDDAAGELPGASQVGMRAVHIRVPREGDQADASAEEWQGPVITSLGGVLRILED